MQAFKRCLARPVTKVGAEGAGQFNFSTGFQGIFFQVALKTRKNLSQWR